MHTTLVRTQMYLEKDVLLKTRKKLKQKKISLASYIRGLMVQNLDDSEKKENSKFQTLASVIGKFKGVGDPNAAKNHNDIYDI